MNIVFGFDIIFNFISAYNGADFQIIDDPKVIFHKYFKTFRILLLSTVRAGSS